jgi:biotin carboxyl carrier protein
MKMELALVAPHPGEVTAVRAQVGDKVSPGEVLVDITPMAPSSEEIP